MNLRTLSDFHEYTVYFINEFVIDRYTCCYILKNNKNLSYKMSFTNSNLYFDIEDISRLIHLWELDDSQLRNRIKNELLVIINKGCKQFGSSNPQITINV